MIHVFHGFLGGPEDFDFLKSPEVELHNLYEMKMFPEVGPLDTLIGYSMGGRIALEIADRLDYEIKKLVLINAHPGLETEEERMSRAQFEAQVLQELRTKSMDDFLEYWNDLPIFFHDQPLRLSDPKRYQQSADLFETYRLSKQKDHLPLIVKNKHKVLYVAGLFDEKYMDLVQEMLLPYDVPVKGIPGGHRLFQHPKELLHVLKTEGIL